MDGAEFVRSMYDAFNRRDFDYLEGRVTEQTQASLVAFGQDFLGREGFHQFTAGFVEAFSDIQIAPTKVFGSGDDVAAEFRVRGTHSGVLRTPRGDIQPTGKTINYPVAEIWELEGGKVARLRNYTDPGTLMRQLGLA